MEKNNDKLNICEQSELACNQKTNINKQTVIEALTINFKISMDDAVTIENWIKTENKNNGNHMLEKTKEDIFIQANSNGCCNISINGRIIGFVTIMPITMNGESIYEWGSLFVDPEYRCLGLGKKLVENILAKNNNLPIYCVTNVKSVIKINDELNQTKYNKENLSESVLAMIESPGALLPEDIVYGNDEFSKMIKGIY